jgi:hypothetical protein
MTKYNLYVTDWAPNGTNTLLVCDEDHQIIAAVEEATFGINVMEHRSPINDLIADGDQVFSTKRLPDGEELPSEFTFVRAIRPSDLFLKRAKSPVDPNGYKPFQELKRLGIDLGYRYYDEDYGKER